MKKITFFIISLFSLSFVSLFYPISIKTAQKINSVVLATSNEEVTVSYLSSKVNNIVTYAMGIGGLIAFILIIVGAFQIILSAGNPDRVKAGKEMITSAITGLLLIIFSVFILKIIGYDILKIPGFGE
jgi:hypothetical protein